MRNETQLCKVCRQLYFSSLKIATYTWRLLGLTLLFGVVTTLLPGSARAQQLCENSASAVAKISPCTGPAGTTITIGLQRKLKSSPSTLLFKRILTNGVPAQVTAPVSGLTASAPPQLCANGGGRWQVWLTDASGKSQGVIGAFWPDCRATTGGGAPGTTGPTNLPPSASQKLCENSDSAVAKISPCTGPPGTKINIALRRSLASPPQTLLFKRVLANGVPAAVSISVSALKATTTAQLCTTGGGRWEVWLADAAGTNLGVVGAFWPDCTAITNPTGGGGGGPKGGPNPPGGSIDPCLVGTWEATGFVQLSNAGGGITGGTGFHVTFKSDGTETVDYSGMKTIVFNDNTPTTPDTLSVTGTASGHISTNAKVATILKIDRASATETFNAGGRIFSLKFPGLGPGGLGSTVRNNNYVCAGNSLSYMTSVASDKHPTNALKLTRR